jgi:hypothetical protein
VTKLRVHEVVRWQRPWLAATLRHMIAELPAGGVAQTRRGGADRRPDPQQPAAAGGQAVRWDQRISPAIRLTEPPTITTPNRYDSSA